RLIMQGRYAIRITLIRFKLQHSSRYVNSTFDMPASKLLRLSDVDDDRLLVRLHTLRYLQNRYFINHTFSLTDQLLNSLSFHFSLYLRLNFPNTRLTCTCSLSNPDSL